MNRLPIDAVGSVFFPCLAVVNVQLIITITIQFEMIHPILYPFACSLFTVIEYSIIGTFHTSSRVGKSHDIEAD